MKIHCEYTKLIPVSELKGMFHDKNCNNHPKEQIERLAKILKYQGIRYPVKVSKRSGKITSGHGRVLAAELNGWESFPVSVQEYENEEMEYADLVADNAIALWSDLDYSAINLELQSLGTDVNLEFLGLENFTVDVSSKQNPMDEWHGMPEFTQIDKTSFRHAIVHFANEKDVEEFFRIIGQKDTGNTKSIWFPPQERMDTESKRYE